MGKTNTNHLAIIKQFKERLEDESCQTDVSEMVIRSDRLECGTLDKVNCDGAVSIGFEVSHLTAGRTQRFTTNDLHSALFGDEHRCRQAIPLLDHTMHFVETVKDLPRSGLAAVLLNDCLQEIMSMIASYLDSLPENQQAQPIFERGRFRRR